MSKLLIGSTIISVILFGVMLLLPSKKSFSPASNNQHLDHQLRSNLDNFGLKPLDINIDISNKIISFTLVDGNLPCQVIFSTQKDIYLQTNVLQKLFKTVRINHQHLAKIDLSLQKPYATIENY